MVQKTKVLLIGLTLLSMLLASCAPGATATPTTTASVPGVTATTAGTTPTGAATTGATATGAATTAAGTTTPTGQATTSATQTTPSATTAGTTATPAGSTGALRTPQQAALDAAGGKQLGGSVSFLGPWGSGEQDSFLAMVKPFEDATGVKVNYTGSRDESALLVTQVQGGNPPDMADFANPGQINQFAQQGKLVDLSTFMDMNALQSQYAKTWLDLGTSNGKFVAMIVKAATKGLIWYNPKEFQAKGYQIPKTWDDMINLSNQIVSSGGTPWCEALESGAASGWPGTDWIEDIVLRQNGADFYNNWWAGKVAWNSPEIKKAWQTYGTIVGDPKMVYGGVNSMLTTNFQNVGTPLFTTPPGCDMLHQASFISSFFTQNNPQLKPVQDFNFFPFPNFTANAQPSTEMAGDLVALFKSTPQSQALIKYLSTPEAQAIWAARGGGYLSANKAVPVSTYPDDLSRNAAQILTSAQVAVFDASDQMPQQLNAEFYKGILNYVQNPSSLDSILSSLDAVRKTSYK